MRLQGYKSENSFTKKIKKTTVYGRLRGWTLKVPRLHMEGWKVGNRLQDEKVATRLRDTSLT